MQVESDVPTDVMHELKCSLCGRFLLSKADMVDHLKSHGERDNQAVYEEDLLACLTIPACPTSGLACHLAGGLTRHSKIHRDVLQLK